MRNHEVKQGQQVKIVDTDERVTITQVGQRDNVVVTGGRVFHASELTGLEIPPCASEDPAHPGLTCHLIACHAGDHYALGYRWTNGPEVTVNGWHYDPSEQAWTAKVGPSRWLIIKGDLADPPTSSPRSIIERTV
jgi:hypothetical protein